MKVFDIVRSISKSGHIKFFGFVLWMSIVVLMAVNVFGGESIVVCSDFVETADGKWYCADDKKVYECDSVSAKSLEKECKNSKSLGDLTKFHYLDLEKTDKTDKEIFYTKYKSINVEKKAINDFVVDWGEDKGKLINKKIVWLHKVDVLGCVDEEGESVWNEVNQTYYNKTIQKCGVVVGSEIVEVEVSEKEVSLILSDKGYKDFNFRIEAEFDSSTCEVIEYGTFYNTIHCLADPVISFGGYSYPEWDVWESYESNWNGVFYQTEEDGNGNLTLTSTNTNGSFSASNVDCGGGACIWDELIYAMDDITKKIVETSSDSYDVYDEFNDASINTTAFTYNGGYNGWTEGSGESGGMQRICWAGDGPGSGNGKWTTDLNMKQVDFKFKIFADRNDCGDSYSSLTRSTGDTDTDFVISTSQAVDVGNTIIYDFSGEIIVGGGGGGSCPSCSYALGENVTLIGTWSDATTLNIKFCYGGGDGETNCHANNKTISSLSGATYYIGWDTFGSGTSSAWLSMNFFRLNPTSGGTHESYVGVDACFSEDNVTFTDCQYNVTSGTDLGNDTAKYGNFTANFIRTDGSITSAKIESINITYSDANTAPVWGVWDDFSINEDDYKTPFTFNLYPNITDGEDVDGDLEFSWIDSDVSAVKVDSINNATGDLVLSTVANQSGSNTITLIAVDTGGLTGSDDITITVSAVNDAPWWNFIGDIARLEDFDLFSMNLSSNISDVEDEDTTLQVSYSVNNSNVTLSFENTTNVLTVSPVADAFDTANISLTLVDTGGLTAFESFDLVLISVNDAPGIIDGNSSSLERPWVNYTNETDVNFEENDTVRLEVGAEDVEGDTVWYDWFVDGVLEISDSLVNYFDFVTGFTSAGTYNVTTHAKDYSGLFSFFTWFVTVENVNNPDFAVNFVGPTPGDGETVHTDSVGIAVEIAGPESEDPELKTFFDDINSFTSEGLNNTGLEADFINLSLLNETGTYESRIYNATVNTAWDNLSWSEVLPVTGEITPDANTVLLFHLNNDSSYGENDTFVYDFSSNGNGGIVYGDAHPTSNGKLNGAFEFDGSGDYIDVTSSDFYYNDAVTVEAWIKLDNVTGVQGISTSGEESGTPYWLFQVNDNRLRVYVKNAYYTSDTNLSTGVWYFVAFAGTQSGGGKFYLNGVSDGNIPAWATGSSGTDCSIGRSGGGNYFDGIIDEVAVWNRALTAEEISAHANATVGAAGEIKFQVKSCDDASCNTEVFKGPSSEEDYYETSAGQDLVSVVDNQYFQYKAFFETDTAGTSPELYNVTIEGHSVVEAPELSIETAWVDWNGENKSMSNTSMTDWYITVEDLAEDTYTYRVYANDSYDNSNATEERTVTIEAYDINFSVVDSLTGILLPGTILSIDCSNGVSDTYADNPAGPYDFYYGAYECNFTKVDRYDKTIIFTADSDKNVDVPMSLEKDMTEEEHYWLEMIYKCLYDGNCRASDFLEQLNQTVEKVWKQFLPTDESVVVSENVTSYDLSPSQNISIDYSVDVPVKEGYSDGDLLPIRIFYWFTDDNNECYNQDKQSDSNRAETPYCVPLMAQTLGPMNGNVEFKVDLHPDLPAGTYDIVRSIEIDPKGVWINYGRELLGKITVLEDSNEPSISIGEVETEFMGQQVKQKIVERQNEKEADSGLSKITGNVIGGVLSSSKVNLVIALLFLIVCLLVFQNLTFWKTRKK